MTGSEHTIARTTKPGMTPHVAQARISRDLHDAEAALDAALLLQAQLLSTMVHARRETGAGPYVGHDALLRLVKSQEAMLSAGGELARVHGRLSAIAVDMIGNDPCPPTGLDTAPTVASAQRVADHAAQAA